MGEQTWREGRPRDAGCGTIRARTQRQGRAWTVASMRGLSGRGDRGNTALVCDWVSLQSARCGGP
eukprot:scaffold9205_cov121-Isochrysis_galbana.AAC.2